LKRSSVPARKVYLTVLVQPKAKSPGVVDISPTEYKVRVKSLPARGEANRETEKLLADYFSLPRSQVSIVKGFTSRQKIVSLEQREENPE
jgi:uncharacterized protein (TIGR00251 family)